MDLHRSSQFAGAGAAFALLIAWMVPPTTPKQPLTPAWRSQAKAQQVSAAQLESPAGALPASAYQPSAAEILSRPALARAPSTFNRAPVTDGPVPKLPMEEAVLSRTVIARPATPVRVARAGPSEPGPDDWQDDAPGQEVGYRSGYRWASDTNVEDPRECRRLRGDPGEDGCLDFVREQYDRDEQDTGSE